MHMHVSRGELSIKMVEQQKLGSTSGTSNLAHKHSMAANLASIIADFQSIIASFKSIISTIDECDEVGVT